MHINGILVQGGLINLSNALDWTSRHINSFQTSPGFYVSSAEVFENTVGKVEIARNEQFLLFPQCFLPVCRTFCYFHQIRYCRLQHLSV